MLMKWSTADIPGTQQFGQWREACCQQVYALTLERQGRNPFHGSITRYQQGSLDVADIHCDGHLVQRSQRDINHQPSDTYYIYLQRQGRVWFEQQGRHQLVEPGDLVIADPNIPFTTGTDRIFDFRLWRIDRRRMHARLGLGSAELTMRRIGRESAERELIASWLDGLLRHHAALSPANLDLTLETLNALVVGAVASTSETQEPVRRARRRALLLRVKQVVAERAHEADLTPERVAVALGMSLRTLHQLFTLSDRSFHEFLTLVRLERVHALLRDPACAHLSTAEIGFEAGFGEVSTFYRRFRRHYGMTPGEFRSGEAGAALHDIRSPAS